jgi:hypothetical protein
MCVSMRNNPDLLLFEIISRKWTFTIADGLILNNTCAACAGYAGTWLLVYDPAAFLGGGWVSQPLQAVPCYADLTDSPWQMICSLDLDNILRFHLGMFGANHNRFCAVQDSFDDWAAPALTFNPLAPNVMVKQAPDMSGCRPCDMGGVGNITISPVFT